MNERALQERWDDVMADADATAAEYREAGWEATVCHPGDVNPIPDAGRLDVLLPGSEFDAIHELLTEIDIDRFRVYTAHHGGVGFRLVVAEATADAVALCVPTYLAVAEAGPLRTGARTAGELVIRLRPLDDRDVVDLTLGDPDLYFTDPDAEDRDSESLDAESASEE